MGQVALYQGKIVAIPLIEKNLQVFSEDDLRRASKRREFFCPQEGCENNTLIYKHGEERKPYFSHLGDYEHVQGSTVEHDLISSYVCMLVNQTGQFDFSKLGHKTPSGRIFDGYFERDGLKVGIEIQKSSQKPAEWVSRLRKGTSDGIYTLTIVVPGGYFKNNSPKYRPKLFERFLHDIVGTVYYCNQEELFALRYIMQPTLPFDGRTDEGRKIVGIRKHTLCEIPKATDAIKIQAEEVSLPKSKEIFKIAKFSD